MKVLSRLILFIIILGVVAFGVGTAGGVGVAGAGVGPVRPPGIVAIAGWGKYAERINKAGIYKVLEPYPLFICKAVFANVWLGVG